ncbi:MAG TPA: hypothetical protein VF317_12210 [Dermatophilaceae bacterium]|jgi:hypothetical protein
MHKRTTGLILTGILVTGAVGAVAITPASATTSDNVVTSRLAGIKSALSGLVTNGTLTQAQADKVAGTLESQLPMRGMGGMGGRSGGMGMTQTHDAAAKALGMTSDELYAAVQGGKSLADVAKDQKVSVDSLVKAMVAAAESELATDVKEGTITQAQADTMKSSLTAHITDQVNGVRPGRGQGRGMGGAGWSSSTGNTSGATSSTPSSTT